MFVTISVLIDDLEVVKEQVYTASLYPIMVDTYLAHRRTPEQCYAFTPVRVVVAKRGSLDIHVVEFTGCHYGIHVKPGDAERCRWANTGMVPDTIIPSLSATGRVMHDYQPFVSAPVVRQMTEQESLLHDYALTLANDYFNDRFHLADTGKE